MKFKERIYCIEGVHDWGNQYIEPTIEPMLQMLRFGIGHWEYIRRDCATYSEFEWYIKHEWWKRCKSGSILYLSSHGSPGVFTLSGGRDVSIDQLATLLDEGGAADCLVHFGGCHTFKNKHLVKEFKKKSCAWAVSGFGEESDWSRGLALEYIFLSSLGWWDIEVGNNRHKKRLRNLGNDLRSRFKEFDFQVLV